MLREFISKDWYVVFCLLSLVIILVAKKNDTQRFSAFLKLFGNNNYLRIYLKEHSFFDRFDSLLFINFCVNIIIFGWIGYQFIFGPVAMNLLLFSQLFALVAGVVMLKIGFELFLGYVLDLQTLFNILTFQQISSYNFVGLVLLPVNAFVVFGVDFAPLAIVLSTILILLIVVVGMTKTVQSNLNMLLNNFFYFILYLCTLEIGPYLVLYKALNRD
ncbi:MAG: DUF4271 domain-containing protein [Flavobacteriaceae bacterium]|nr:DUF4271 domain-containing protein [Flavobacteriaceae bacterium]